MTIIQIRWPKTILYLVLGKPWSTFLENAITSVRLVKSKNEDFQIKTYCWKYKLINALIKTLVILIKKFFQKFHMVLVLVNFCKTCKFCAFQERDFKICSTIFYTRSIIASLSYKMNLNNNRIITEYYYNYPFYVFFFFLINFKGN